MTLWQTFPQSCSLVLVHRFLRVFKESRNQGQLYETAIMAALSTYRKPRYAVSLPDNLGLHGQDNASGEAESRPNPPLKHSSALSPQILRLSQVTYHDRSVPNIIKNPFSGA